MSDSLSIFMPFFNDAGTVEFMISEAFKQGSKLTNDLEVVVINDGSTDQTLQKLTLLKDRYPTLKIVDHPKNRGYGGALISGINNTTKNWVFYTDGDAQYHFDELELLWGLRHNYDVVNGFKISRSDNWLRKLVGACYSKAVKVIFDSPIRDIDCDYRLMRGDLLRSLNLHCNSGAITVELVKKLNAETARFKEVGVQHYQRVYGQSTFFTFSNIFQTFKDELILLKELRTHFKSK